MKEYFRLRMSLSDVHTGSHGFSFSCLLRYRPGTIRHNENQSGYRNPLIPLRAHHYAQL